MRGEVRGGWRAEPRVLELGKRFVSSFNSPRCILPWGILLWGIHLCTFYQSPFQTRRSEGAERIPRDGVRVAAGGSGLRALAAQYH